ncbi:GTPase and DUF3482 domain-containing protein [Pusillimonas sp. CC-YST705]|uniref:GTPase and DUF3482 domain-containing protein n=1 Tax=Mesopusillimonas faecipullorum TaxID=2755040 RepID=A0ABS8CCS9_9BURK|nr:DUF3482 domain-containing protein [Mesopusillimonas faecipullorum]MCB5363662.1 GTPase and DUF3482 domain-containing protein [Mesopusillimonas faecipullorum]
MPTPDAVPYLAPTAPLKLAVVGHTNTGKTSLLRTLTRDPDFGEVADQAGTTRHVEGVRLITEGQALVALYDTPGLEDGMGLLDHLDTLHTQGSRDIGPGRIQRFLDSPAAQGRFEQEARVLRQLLDSDAGLYIIDARDPVLGKHRDELAILAQCGKPLLPVLNFVNAPQQRADAWRAALGPLGLHVAASFDTVAPATDGEAQLYDKLALLLDSHAPALQAIKTDIAKQKAARHEQAMQGLAELLIDVAALRLSSPPETAALEQTAKRLRQLVRDREQQCVQMLLALYNFRTSDFPAHALPLSGERWGMDLFSPQALKDMGLQVSKGMAAGAMAGVTVDLLTGGLSLGAAAVLGAAVGGLWQGAERLGKRLLGRIQGYQEVSIDDAVLRLLGLRQLALIEALQRRGHAALAPIKLEPSSSEAGDEARLSEASEAQTQGPKHPLRARSLPEPLLQARVQAQWSTLGDNYKPDDQRTETVRALSLALMNASSDA